MGSNEFKCRWKMVRIRFDISPMLQQISFKGWKAKLSTHLKEFRVQLPTEFCQKKIQMFAG